MKIYFFLLSLICCAFAQAQPILAFERTGSIWTANIDGSHARKVAEGYMPQISPDGKFIAYNIADNNQSTNRYLVLLALESGKITRLKNIPSQNNFNPVWSPDSKQLLFNTFIDNEWYIGLINADDTGYRTIKNTENVYRPTWASNGTSFFSHDLYFIYWLDLKGTLIKKWRIDTLIPKGSMSSGSQLNASPNGEMLIMDVDMDENSPVASWEGAPTELWTFDVNLEKVTRISPKGMLAWSPFWINSQEFVFIEQKKTDKAFGLYRGALKSPTWKFLLNDAQTPSVSR
ncbi:TolB family protein [Legionella saoudiensis]|uniref:TolB family protein n=1 Tax=Legionella saoudiensis TaxID=1750561 RepID=UPI00098F420C|nr:PD40 domain-containing protein [Legionella saoudiensis]